MSRTKNFIRGVASSYILLGFNIAYTLASVPLVLSYLSKEEFGLWALITQVAGYAILLDLGIASSMGRILIDYKDDKTDVRYGSLIQTATLVGIIQGILIVVGAFFLAPFLPRLLALPAEHQELFRILFIAYSAIVAFGFMTRSLCMPLYSHQRYDISNLAQMGQFVALFAGLWIGLYKGMGLYSMLFSGSIGALWSAIFQIIACFRLGFFPKRGYWGSPRMSAFHELFSFGKDVFLMGLGSQMISASPTIIITRVLGLDAAATWSICSKAFTLLQQLTTKIADFSQGALSEMFVRGETVRLLDRFRDMVMLSAAVAIFFGVPATLGNQDFVQIWTKGKIMWHPANNLLMGLYLIILSVTRCYGSIAGITKEIKFARYIYFIEGIVFLGLAIFTARFWGITGIIASFVIVDAIPGVYGLYRSKSFFGISYKAIALEWLRPSARFLSTFVASSLGVVLLTSMLPLEQRFPASVTILSVIGIPLFWNLGLNDTLRQELRRQRAKLKRFSSERI